MKLQVLQERLNQVLSSAGRFVSIRAQLPVLSNIFIQAKQNKLIVSATNLEMSFSTSLGAKIDTDGEVTVPAKVIVDLIAAAPPGPLNLVAEKEQLTVKSPGFESTINGMNANDFPSVAQKAGNESFSIPSQDFKIFLDKLLFAVSNDETRPILNGVLFVRSGKSLELVATDGFRLTRLLIHQAQNKTDSFVVPKNILSEVSKLANDSEKIGISYDSKNNLIVFVIGSTVLSSRVIDGTFPDYKKIIPESTSSQVNIDKGELSQAIKAMAVFARDSSNTVKINFENEEMILSSESNQAGKGKVKVAAKTKGNKANLKDLVVAFNYKFIADYLGCLENEVVEVGLTGSDSPGLFVDPGDKDFLHLIMPVRIES